MRPRQIHIQQKIRNGEYDLVWSYILEFENAQNPFSVRRIAVLQWKSIAKRHIFEDEYILYKAKEFEQLGLKAKDALHVACAIRADADFFITTDKKILRALARSEEVRVVNPVNFVLSMEE